MGAILKEVILHNIIDRMFHAWIVLTTIEKEEKKIDCRASDAISLAVRFECPIYIYDFVLTDAVLLESTKRPSLLKGLLAEYSLEELELLLKDVFAKEDYESATRIRDMIERRK